MVGAFAVFANNATTTVTSGGTDAPATGTPETWTVASSASFPAASSSASPPAQFHVGDIALPGEVIEVTNISGTTWSVIRGAEGSTPVAHAAGFAIVQVVSGGDYASLAVTEWLNPVTMGFGADPTYTNDSGPAVQAAYDTAGAMGQGGGTIYMPPGKYLFNTTVTPVSGVRLTADSRTACKIASTSVPLFNMGPSGSPLLSLEIDHLFLAATNAHLFSGANIERSYIHDCQFQQNSAAYGIWNASAGTGEMVEVVFERNIESVNGTAPRSVPAWFITAATNSNQVNENVWRDETCFSNSGDTTQYWWHIQASGTGSPINDANVWDNVVCESPLGGMIWLESCRGCVISNVNAWDPTASYAQSLIYISQNGSGGACPDNLIIASGRIDGTLGSGAYDIQLDPSCAGTTIMRPRGLTSGPSLNLGGAAKVTVIGLPSGYSVTNPPASVGDAYLNPV